MATEILTRPSADGFKVNSPMQTKIGVVFPENVPPMEAYQSALKMKAPLEKIPVLELKDGELIWSLLTILIDPIDLEEIRRRNKHRHGHFTVYLSPEGYRTLIECWTHPRFGDLLGEYNGKTPPTKDAILQTVTDIASYPTDRAQDQQAQLISV